MEIIYEDKTIKVHKHSTTTTETFYSVAHADFDGIKLWFGSYGKGAVDTIIEDMTGVRCGYPQHPYNSLLNRAKTIRDKCEVLKADLLHKIQRSGCSFYEVRDNYIRGMRPSGEPKLISVWHISLLIGC